MDDHDHSLDNPTDDDYAALLERIENLTRAATDGEAAKREIADLERRLAAMTENLRRLQSRKSVRLALALAARTRFVRVPRTVRDPRWVRRLKDWRSRLRVRSARKSKSRVAGPAVTVVIPTHNGARQLHSCLRGLSRRTSYRDFAVIVVDNASTDDTDAIVRASQLDISTIRNTSNRTFSEACNQGLAAAHTPYVLFLNNDVSPINAGWLGAMVTALEEDPSAAAAGALLTFPITSRSGVRDPLASTIQHAGVAFGWHQGAPRGIHVRRGEDPTTSDLLETRTVPAATAACMLVEVAATRSISGFDEGFIYGWEDVDLCLRLNQAGHRTIFVGSAALEHHESSTQKAAGKAMRDANLRINSRRFWDWWSPTLSPLILEDQIAGCGYWSTTKVKTAAIAVTSVESSDGFGDLYTGQELAAALQNDGWTVELLAKADDGWYRTSPDVSLVVALLPEYDPRKAPPGAVTVGWVRNWVERWVGNVGLHAFDLLAVATQAFANDLAGVTSVPQVAMPLATNPGRFFPGEVDPSSRSDIAIVANRWGTARGALDLLDVDASESVALYGKNWDGDPRAQRFWRGHADYNDLPGIYRSTGVLIDDTVPPNRPALNARVFDGLASGALVVTDNAEGSAELFDSILPTYTDRRDLRGLLDKYRAPLERRDLAERLRSMVLARHTYAHRSSTLLDSVSEAATSTWIVIRIGPPNWDVAYQWGDTHFALQLATRLRWQGVLPSVALLDEWEDPRHARAQISLHLRGLRPSVPKPGQVNLMWVISHPTEVDPHECDRFDAVLVASHSYAETLRRTVRVPVHVVLQVADARRHRPAQPTDGSRVVFVGNSRGVRRRMVDWALDAGLDLEIYGDGWDGLVPPSVVKATYFPNRDIPDLYAGAAIVLNDHWPDMAENGFVSNRILDALASGAFVISDAVAGLDEMLGGAVPTCRSASELRLLADRYLADPAARAAKAQAGQSIVLAEHTFEHRAERILTVARPFLEAKAADRALMGPDVSG